MLLCESDCRSMLGYMHHALLAPIGLTARGFLGSSTIFLCSELRTFMHTTQRHRGPLFGMDAFLYQF